MKLMWAALSGKEGGKMQTMWVDKWEKSLLPSRFNSHLDMHNVKIVEKVGSNSAGKKKRIGF